MKVTERDKVLLVLLGVILIVALVVIMPGFGVMACRDSLSSYETKSQELQRDLDTKRAALIDMGVRQYQENSARAERYLEELVFDLKKEASHLAGNVMVYAKPYAVDEAWVEGLEYRYGAKSEDSEKLLEYSAIMDVDVSGNNEDEIFAIDGKNYQLPSAKRDISFTIAESAKCTYEVDMTMDDYSAEDLGAIFLYLQHISAKGSILITDLKIAGDKHISFTLLMPPEGSGIKRYAQEVEEELMRRAAEENGEEEE